MDRDVRKNERQPIELGLMVQAYDSEHRYKKWGNTRSFKNLIVVFTVFKGEGIRRGVSLEALKHMLFETLIL